MMVSQGKFDDQYCYSIISNCGSSDVMTDDEYYWPVLAYWSSINIDFNGNDQWNDRNGIVNVLLMTMTQW